MLGSSWNNEDGARRKRALQGSLNVSSCNNNVDSNGIIPAVLLFKKLSGMIQFESTVLLHDDTLIVPRTTLFHPAPSSSAVLFHEFVKSLNHNLILESIEKPSCYDFNSPRVQGDIYIRASSFSSWGALCTS